MSIYVNRPETLYAAKNEFSQREVGLTHPDWPSFFRLTNKGNAEIVCAPGLAIIMDATNKSITFIADDVKFITNDKNGLKWNGLSFNSKATTFNEPTFLQLDTNEFSSMYTGFEDFLT